jgi:hypothetical protein
MNHLYSITLMQVITVPWDARYTVLLLYKDATVSFTIG